MSALVKICYGDDMRRVPFPRLPLFSELTALVAQLFPALKNAYSIKYVDNEGDSITIASDADILEAMSAASKPIRFFVVEKPAPVPVPSEPLPATSTATSTLPVFDAASKCPFGGRRGGWRSAAKAEGGCPKDVHYGVQCDECKAFPIVGVRYKCTSCDNFDLCGACEAKKAHDPTHTFEIATPRFFPRFHGRRQFCAAPAEPITPQGDSAATAPVPVCAWAGKFKRTKYLARFVADVSCPQGTAVKPGEVFVKVWKVKNTGSLAWPQQTTLSFASGDQLGAPLHVMVGSLAEDGVKEIQVPCVAPSRPGRYLSSWKLHDNVDGCRFGQRLWIDIVVATPAEKPADVPETMVPAPLPAPVTSFPTVTPAPAPVEPVPLPIAALPPTPDEIKMLNTLVEMGFVNADLLAIIRRHKGRLAGAIRELVGTRNW